MMICPKCGAENAEGAGFCSLCMEPLQPMTTTEAPSLGAPRTGTGGRYTAPSEWRGDVVGPRPRASKVAESKIKRFRMKIAFYGLVIAALIAWLVLSFTLWGNPSPGRRATQLLEALNAGNPETFASIFLEQERASANDLYRKVRDFLGDGGAFRDVRFKVDKKDAYSAYAYLEEGTVDLGGGSALVIDPADKLVIYLENRSGKWYASTRGTKLIP